MTHPVQICPSLLSCDFARLGEEIAAVEHAGAGRIHFDCMDGHFVPNLSIGLPILEAVRRVTTLPIDCHLMITNPEAFISAFATAGATSIAVHVETCDANITLPQIRAAGCVAGIACNPETPLDAVTPHLALCDYVLIMSVHPGFGGQKFLEPSLEKIRTLAAHLHAHNLQIDIMIDGGITPDTAAAVRTAGANWLVAGKSLFASQNYAETMLSLRGGGTADSAIT